MITRDSRKKIIPPTQLCVKAGFVVSSPEDKDKKIILLNEGELVALDPKSNKVVFKILPGNLVGVGALLERESVRYIFQATVDSSITIINNECLESELKSLPVWLLAVIKAISARTRKINDSIRSAKTDNVLASLASFCKFYKSDDFLQTKALLQEFSWLTKTPIPAASEALKALIRRKLVVFHGDKTCLSVPNPYLLGIFSDYQKAKDLDKPWGPFCLTLQQKRILVLLSTLENGTSKDATDWISFFKERNLEINVADWLQIQQFEWFTEKGNHLLSLDLKKINYYETALKYAQNIKGTV
jgi:CRP-like cAMP-binding protein